MSPLASAMALATLAAACEAAADVQKSPFQTSVATLPGLSEEERARFQEGAGEFSEIESVAEGLGPFFNGSSCGHWDALGAADLDDTRRLDALSRAGSSANEVTEHSRRGVGLSAVRKIVEGLGGKVTVRSRRGEGTEVTATVPGDGIFRVTPLAAFGGVTS